MDDISILNEACFDSFLVLPNARRLEREGMRGVATEVPINFFSGVAWSQSEDVDGALEFFGRQSFRWWITPSTLPRDLPSRLIAKGLRHTYDAKGMLADLTKQPLTRPSATLAPRTRGEGQHRSSPRVRGEGARRADEGPPLEIRRVRNVEEMQSWVEVFVPGFHRPELEAGIWLDTYARCGFDDAWQHFVGFVDDRPVATTSLLMAGELAGIYHVLTAEKMRGRGYGAAVTDAAMRHARALGAVKAALQSSELGFSVYRALGFEEISDLTLYDWRI